jgi:hypothetical protein
VDKFHLYEVLTSIYKLFKQENSETEVSFFVEMIFKMADNDKDNLLNTHEFKEAVLLQPFIMKCFHLDTPKQTRLVSIKLQKESEEKKELNVASFLEKLRLST